MHRRKPITRDEVRLTDRGYIATLPADSVRPGKYKSGRLTGDMVPIQTLWEPLVQALKQQQDEHNAWMKDVWGNRFHAPDPIRTPRPNWRSPELECRHCGRGFYNAQRCFGTYCSDKCCRAKNAVAYVKARSETRAANRKNLHCENETCGKKLEAARSTARFCSVRCRVAAHRQVCGDTL